MPVDIRWPRRSRARRAWEDIERLRERFDDRLLPGLNALLDVGEDPLLRDERDSLAYQLENGIRDLVGPNDEELVRLINWGSLLSVLGTQLEYIAVLLTTRSERVQTQAPPDGSRRIAAPHEDKKRMLHDLLCDFFDGAPSHLRRFIRLGERGGALAQELPGELASLQELVDRVVGELCRFGHVPETLRRMCIEFPRRSAEIERVLAAWK